MGRNDVGVGLGNWGLCQEEMPYYLISGWREIAKAGPKPRGGWVQLHKGNLRELGGGALRGDEDKAWVSGQGFHRAALWAVGSHQQWGTQHVPHFTHADHHPAVSADCTDWLVTYLGPFQRPLSSHNSTQELWASWHLSSWQKLLGLKKKK